MAGLFSTNGNVHVKLERLQRILGKVKADEESWEVTASTHLVRWSSQTVDRVASTGFLSQICRYRYHSTWFFTLSPSPTHNISYQNSWTRRPTTALCPWQAFNISPLVVASQAPEFLQSFSPSDGYLGYDITTQRTRVVHHFATESTRQIQRTTNAMKEDWSSSEYLPTESESSSSSDLLTDFDQSQPDYAIEKNELVQRRRRKLQKIRQGDGKRSHTRTHTTKKRRRPESRFALPFNISFEDNPLFKIISECLSWILLILGKVIYLLQWPIALAVSLLLSYFLVYLGLNVFTSFTIPNFHANPCSLPLISSLKVCRSAGSAQPPKLYPLMKKGLAYTSTLEEMQNIGASSVDLPYYLRVGEDGVRRMIIQLSASDLPTK